AKMVNDTGTIKEEYSLFPKQDTSSGSEGGNATATEFTLQGVFLMNGKYMSSFWELFLAILAWMAVTYITVHIIAATVALVKLRNHPYGIFVAIPLLCRLRLRYSKNLCYSNVRGGTCYCGSRDVSCSRLVTSSRKQGGFTVALYGTGSSPDCTHSIRLILKSISDALVMTTIIIKQTDY
ncbi:hypothetical protein PFISCL1PPCAC_20458, partial [Pristionchus fissidentatus]